MIPKEDLNGKEWTLKRLPDSHWGKGRGARAGKLSRVGELYLESEEWQSISEKYNLPGSKWYNRIIPVWKRIIMSFHSGHVLLIAHSSYDLNEFIRKYELIVEFEEK